MPSTVHIDIRPYEPADRSALLSIGQAVIDDGTTFPFLSLGGVEAYWLNEQSEVFVAVLDSLLAGTYALKPNLPGRGNHVCNAGYMVSPSCRGRGVGRALGEHSLVIARQRGYCAMQFNHVVATNVHAIKLWKRLGFRVVGEVPGAFRHPNGNLVATLVMYRELQQEPSILHRNQVFLAAPSKRSSKEA